MKFWEVLRQVQDHTAFELGEPASSKFFRSVSKQSQDKLLSVEPSFVALLCFFAITEFAAKRTEPAQAPNAGKVGYMAPVYKSSMKP